MYDNHKWYKKRFKKRIYFARSDYSRDRNNPETILFHRYKMEKKLKRKLRKDEIVDHFDGDTLNNNYSNLRVLTFHENIISQKSRGATQGRGITWDKDAKKYRVRICLNYKRIDLGRFKTLEEAKAAYKQKAKELYKGVANENLFG